MKGGPEQIVVRALQTRQADGIDVYAFFLYGADLCRIADISRVTREGGDLKGFQRREIRNHVKSIVEFLDTGPVLFPNAIILALSPEDHGGIGHLLSTAPLGPSIDEICTTSAAIGADDARKEALFGALGRLHPRTKCVVFCSSGETAESVAAFLEARLGAASARAAGEDREHTLTAFLEDPGCRVLVCDRTDEEGLNLQGGAKAIIHYDLPVSPNRIEQRIGRLDRYGSGKPVQSFILTCSNEPYQAAWQACLADALGVFRRSIASLQYLIEAYLQDLRKSLLIEGYESIVAMGARLGGENGEVAREMRRIDHQDALDALVRPREGDLEHLDEIEVDWKVFQQRVDDWLVTCLKMSHEPGPRVGALTPGEWVGRYALQRGRNPTLIPLSRFVGTMLGALDLNAPGATSGRPLTFAYAARRRTALSRRSAGCRKKWSNFMASNAPFAPAANVGALAEDD